MPMTQKLRKWHFLMLGSVLVLLSSYMWYWSWRRFGIPEATCPEHCIILVTYIVGIAVLGIFIYRLDRRQVTIMLVGLVVVNLIAVSGTVIIYRNMQGFFNLISPPDHSGSISKYMDFWDGGFLRPVIYLGHGGLILLWLENLVMFLIRKPADHPE